MSLVELVGEGRYVVEVNVDAIAGDQAGAWEVFTIHDELMDAVRACSAFMNLAKAQLGAGFLDSWLDEMIEPWIRVSDLWNERSVLWHEGAGLRLEAGD